MSSALAAFGLLAANATATIARSVKTSFDRFISFLLFSGDYGEMGVILCAARDGGQSFVRKRMKAGPTPAEEGR